MHGFFRTWRYVKSTTTLLEAIEFLTISIANDLSNAIGPFAVIYHVWKTGEIADKKSPVEIWNLVFGAVCLCIGLATCMPSPFLPLRVLLTDHFEIPDGYNIMRVLGNRITLHSPSRGFSMELGASITVILASQYGLPVSVSISLFYFRFRSNIVIHLRRRCVSSVQQLVSLCVTETGVQPTGALFSGSLADGY